MGVLKRISFWTGLVLVLISLIGLFWQPQGAPSWWQARWGVPIVKNVGGTSAEKAHPGYRQGLWVGHGKTAESSQLDLGVPAIRHESALADARVDARAQYRGRMAGIGILGLLLMLLGLLGRVATTDTTAKSPDANPEGTPENPAEGGEKGEPATEPSGDKKPNVSSTAAEAEQPTTEETEALSSELVVTWRRGDDAPFSLAMKGRQLDRAESVATFFDLSNGQVRSAKASLEFVKRDRR